MVIIVWGQLQYRSYCQPSSPFPSGTGSQAPMIIIKKIISIIKIIINMIKIMMIIIKIMINIITNMIIIMMSYLHHVLCCTQICCAFCKLKFKKGFRIKVLSICMNRYNSYWIMSEWFMDDGWLMDNGTLMVMDKTIWAWVCEAWNTLDVIDNRSSILDER